MALNRVLLQGRLTRDVESRTVGDGIAVCKFTIAVDGKPNKNGEKQTDFIDCQAWRGTANFLERYFYKGSAIVVEGSLHNNDYTDKDGVKHYRMIVNVEQVHFCGGKSDNQQSVQPVQNSPPQSQHPAANNVAEALNVQDIAEFEEILSDGEVPF